MWKNLFNIKTGFCFDTPGEGAGGGTGVPAAAASGEPAKPAAGAPAQPDIAKLVADAVAQAVAPLIAAREAAPATPAAPAPIDDLDQEIKVREEQLAAIERGEIDASYRPSVQRAHSTAIARKEGRTIVERENSRNGFVSEYNQAVAVAHAEFPDLKDANTELSKETVRILTTSKSHARVSKALNVRGRDAEKMDWESLDPHTVISAARSAHSIITRRKAAGPVSTQPGAGAPPRAAAAALEAGAGALPTGDEDIAALEAKAVASGDQSDWRRLIKAKDLRAQQRKVMPA